MLKPETQSDDMHVSWASERRKGSSYTYGDIAALEKKIKPLDYYPKDKK